MSFFKELKEDLAQAVDELIPEEAAGEEEAVDRDIPYEDDQIVNTLEETVPEEDEEEYNLEEEEDNVDAELLAQMAREEEEEGVQVPERTPEEISVLEGEAKRDLTVITKGTIINGSIISDGSLEVNGMINGDIECLGKLSIMGSVKGNSTAAEVYVNTSRLDGGINSKGSVKIGVGTVVVGDITAASSVIAGAVKGQIDVNGPVIVDSTAVIKGNINAKAVQINNGAVMEGFCSLSYSDVDIDTFFDGEE